MLLCLLLASPPPAAAGPLAESLWTEASAPETGALLDACPGAYRRAAAKPPPTAATVELTATRLQSESDGGTAASGSVAVRDGQRLLLADEFSFDRATGAGHSPGPLRLREPGLEASGHRLRLATPGSRLRLEDVEFVLLEPQLRGTAERAEGEASVLRLAAPALTRCPPHSDVWRLEADRIRIDRDAGAATVRGARLRLGGVPVFYSPYLRLPLGGRRTSGWLFPGFGTRDGFDLLLPYYLALAPNYDATLSGRWIRDRGAGLEGEFRHQGRRAESVLQAAFLARDEDYDGALSRAAFRAEHPGGATFVPAHRWLLAARHRGDYGRLDTVVDFAGVSDNDYFVDLGADLAATGRLLLERRAEARYAHGGLLARVALQDFQRLEPGPAPYRRLPEASLAYEGASLGPLSWRFGGSWTAFERPGGGAEPAGSRLHLEPQIRLPLERSWGFLGLAAKLRHTVYDLRGPGPDAGRHTRSIAAATVDGGLVLERPRPGGGLQVLEPRLAYRYQSYADQDGLPRFDVGRLTFSYRQLFRDNRFAGLDRLADANELAIGLATRLLDGAGNERLAAAIGTVAYFVDHRVALADAPRPPARRSTSPLAGELAGRFGPWRLRGAVAWDPEAGRTDSASLHLAYGVGARRLVNVGYRRRTAGAGQPTEHTDISVHWPLARQWQVFGRWNHDWRFGRTIETLAGVGYASCCLEVKLLWHDTVAVARNRPATDPARNRGLLVQFALRGLAGFGGNVDGRLERSIRGYRRSP